MQKLLYIMLAILFCISFSFTLYFGKKTFHVRKEALQEKPEYQYHFVLIPEEVDNEYWRIVEQGARSEAEKHRVYLEYLGPKQANNEDQLKTIDKAIAGKVDGILTQAVSDPDFTFLINKAVEKRIPVITIDTDAPDSERVAYIGTDNYYAGYLAGQALLSDTKGEQYVGIVIGRYSGIHQKLRVQGFRDAVKKEKRIHIVGIKESKITKVGAVQATYDLLKEHPNLTAVYGTSSLDGIGIARVVKNRLPHRDLYIIAFDTLPETIRLIEEGTIDATVVQYPYEMGKKGVDMLLKLKKGERIEPILYTETKIIRRKDISKGDRS